jgi:hypothetical protein
MKFARSTVALMLLATIGIAGAHAGIPTPNVPPQLQVPVGNSVYFVGHAVGTQNYVCLPSGDGVKFVLFTPQATLFSDDDKQVTTHFFSPNPFENGTIRATWQHSRDSSAVWAHVNDGDTATFATDPSFVAVGAVPWVKLTVTKPGAENGPAGGDTLTKTTFIQRINTAGGVAPATGCTALADVGHEAFVHYTADYVFYTDR